MKNKVYDVILFVGGSFITLTSIIGGLRWETLRGTWRGWEDWAIIGIVVGICMIIFGFLRRNWNKKK